MSIKRISSSLLLSLTLNYSFLVANASPSPADWSNQIVGVGRKMCSPDAYEAAKWQAVNVTGIDMSMYHFRQVSRMLDQIGAAIASQPLTEAEIDGGMSAQQRNIEIFNLIQNEKKYVYDNCPGYSYD